MNKKSPDMALWFENAVNFELKLSNQMEKETNKKWSGNGVGDKIKTMQNLGIVNKNWFQTWGPEMRWKKLNGNYYSNIALLRKVESKEFKQHKICCHSKYRYPHQILLSIVSWFSEFGHLFLARSKTKH